jgi:ribosomal protein S18 acetylase RimI-like enzyme
VRIVVREFRSGDGHALARMSEENSRYYTRLAPDYFKEPDEEGLVDFFESDEEWRSSPDNLALVVEADGEVAGYLEASVQPPLDSARWQGQRDLAEIRLFINYVGTLDAYKRQGVATRLVQEAEAWGRAKGAVVALCDTYIDSPLSVPFWEQRMGYTRRSIRLRKALEPS